MVSRSTGDGGSLAPVNYLLAVVGSNAPIAGELEAAELIGESIP